MLTAHSQSLLETEMRSAGLMAGALLVAASLGAAGLGTGSAFAASSNPQMALSTRLGGTTCGHFMRLSKSGRNSLVHRLVRAAPARTLATIPPASNGGGKMASTSSSTGTNNATARSMAPLKASDIAAACQAATGASTIRAAYAKFALGGSATSGQ
jgi:hypothetical protein